MSVNPKGRIDMCDYSLEGREHRPARVGEDISTTTFGTGSVGTAATSEVSALGGDSTQATAVCLLPGTKLSVTDVPKEALNLGAPPADENAIFDQNTDVQLYYDEDTGRMMPTDYRDGILFSNGNFVLMQNMLGATMTVMALPRIEPDADEDVPGERILEKTK